jgi:hypothetical protein
MGQDILGVIVHNDGHTVHAEAVSLGGHALAETIRDMVRAQQPRDHHADVERDEAEGCNVPTFEDESLKVQVRFFASGENTPCVTRGADSGFDERAKIAAATQ